MKTKILSQILILFLICFVPKVYSQDTLFKTFNNKRVNDVKQINSNLFLLTGESYPKGYYLYLDSNFNKVSDLSYNDAIYHQFSFKESVPLNNKIYTTGYCSYNDLIGEYYKAFIGCLDFNGNVIWQYKIDTTNYDYMGMGIKYVNNLFHILVYKNVEDKYSRANITVVDTNGIILKSKDFLDTTFKHNQPNGFIALSDSSYIILEYQFFQVNAPINYSNQLIKINKNLDTVFTLNATHGKDDLLNIIHPTYDGNFLIAGTNLLPTSTQSNGVIIKYDTNINLLWSKQFNIDTNNSEKINTIDEMPDKTLMLSAFNWQNLILYKLDSLGNLIWANKNSINRLVDKINITKIISSNNNGYYIFGNNYFIPTDTTISNYIIAIKTDSNGNFEYATAINPITKPSIDINIYPNPANEILNINSSMPFLQINMLDIFGQVIKTYPVSTKQINLQDIPTGNYFLKLNFKDGYKVIKFIKK